MTQKSQQSWGVRGAAFQHRRRRTRGVTGQSSIGWGRRELLLRLRGGGAEGDDASSEYDEDGASEESEAAEKGRKVKQQGGAEEEEGEEEEGGEDEEEEEAQEEEGHTPSHATAALVESEGVISVVRKLFDKVVHLLEEWWGKGGGSRSGSKSSKNAKLEAELLRPKGGGNSNAATRGGQGGFQAAFENKFGGLQSHPAFSAKSFQEATDEARRTNKFTLVVITSGAGSKASRADDDTLMAALADEEVGAFIDETFVLWTSTAATPGKGGGGAVAKRLGARSFPFLCVVHTSAKTNKRRVASLHHCNPPPSPPQMRSWMRRLQQLNEDKLKKDRQALEKINDEMTYFAERREGYKQSVKDDRVREKREKGEERDRIAREELQQQLEAEALAQQEAQQAEDAARRLAKHEALQEEGEPPQDAPLKDVATVMLKMSDGKRHKRRFWRHTGTMGRVLDWADVLEVDLTTHRLTCAFPKASFSSPEDDATLLSAAGLGKQALLFVEPRPKDQSKVELPGAGAGEGEAAGGGAADA